MKKRIAIIIFLTILALASLVFIVIKENLLNKKQPAQNDKSAELKMEAGQTSKKLKNQTRKSLDSASDKKSEKQIIINISKLVKLPLPESIDLDVPFTSQAPHANWTMPWQEGCEEAALMMIHYYLLGRGGVLDKDFANEEILKMVDWQIKNWGGHYDLPAEEIAKLAREYYGYKNVEVIYDISVGDIKREVGQKNPVLIPSAGRKLANPYFTPPGPVYHNLVVVGYDQNGFITNDPGIWQGHKFRYTYENLLDSAHDFVAGTSKANPNPILNGRGVMIVIKKHST